MSDEAPALSDPFALADAIMARSLARHKAEWPQRRAELKAEQERQRLSTIDMFLGHLRVVVEQRRQALVAGALQNEIPVADQFDSEAGRNASIGLLQSNNQLRDEYPHSAGPYLQFLDFFIDILRHAESPFVDAGDDTAESADAHRSNDGDQ